MTFSEQIDKFAKETKDTVDILCRIAKRQGKDEMLDIIDDIKAEIQQVVEEEADDERWSRGLKYALKIIDKHTEKERSE